jgi:hypothetical protein
MKVINNKFYFTTLEGGKIEVGLLLPNPYLGMLPELIKKGWRFRDNTHEFIYLKELRVSVEDLTKEHITTPLFYMHPSLVKSDEEYLEEACDFNEFSDEEINLLTQLIKQLKFYRL